MKRIVTSISDIPKAGGAVGSKTGWFLPARPPQSCCSSQPGGDELTGSSAGSSTWVRWLGNQCARFKEHVLSWTGERNKGACSKFGTQSYLVPGWV